MSDPTAGINLGSLEERNSPGWDQFEVNSRRFQVKSTYQEDLYTTPLDVAAIPQSVKDKADQIAREIEAAQFGTLDPEQLGEGDLEDDEEARFGAVRGTGAYRASPGQPTDQSTFPLSPNLQPISRSGQRGSPAPPAPSQANTTAATTTTTPTTASVRKGGTSTSQKISSGNAAPERGGAVGSKVRAQWRLLVASAVRVHYHNRASGRNEFIVHSNKKSIYCR